MSILQAVIVIQVLALAVMVGVLLPAIRKKDMGWVDVGWSTGLGIAAIAGAVLLDGYAPRKWLIATLVGLWSARLVWHILANRIIGKPEDARYRMLRDVWGHRAPLYMPLLFLGESLLVTVFAVPLLIVMGRSETVFTFWDLAGVLLWLVAVGGEALADRQLERFRQTPGQRGQTCRDGLWRYSRHPNYFFEWLHWWVYVLMAIGAPGFWVTLAAPLLMFLFLFKVTGIPHTERQALARRGDDYRRYQKETSIFFPWFPRQEAKP